MADAGRHAQEYRHLEAFGEGEGGQREIVGFLRIGGFEDRDMGKTPPVTRILLVL